MHYYLCYHPSDPSVVDTHLTVFSMPDSACHCSRAIICLFVCYLALNLMTVESGS